MKQRMKTNAKHATRGAAAAELALVAPMLILLMIGIFEVGRYADYAIKVANAARAGVQYGAQSITTASDTASIQAAALGEAGTLGGLTATANTYCTCADGGADAGCAANTCSADHQIVYVRVVTAGTISPIFSYPGIPGTLTVHGLAIMRVAE